MQENIITNLGEFAGLGGSANKPIVADRCGTAVDTSTGSVFNAVLSAPAGSKVVNPVTTVVNELMQIICVWRDNCSNLESYRYLGWRQLHQRRLVTKFDQFQKDVFR